MTTLPEIDRPDYGAYARFLLWTVSAAVAVALLGWLPVVNLAGPLGLRSWFVGCAVGVLASALGGIPVLLLGTAGAVGIVASMAVRFLAALGLALATALSGLFLKGPLLIGVAVSYLALLVTDTRFALQGSTSEEEK